MQSLAAEVVGAVAAVAVARLILKRRSSARGERLTAGAAAATSSGGQQSRPRRGKQALLAAARAAGQEHVFADWDRLTGAQQEQLVEALQDTDFDYINHIFKASHALAEVKRQPPEPLESVTRLEDVSDGQELRWIETGFKLVAEGRLGVLLLAGGQGTRLGSAAPKGCYDIGLPSHKPLFQLQAERIARIQALAAEHVYGEGAQPRKRLRWYIMTSPATDADTRRFFAEHAFFGLNPDQVKFFQQGMLPCLDRAGRIIMAQPHQPATAPDGNGGVYLGLHQSGMLDDMRAAGVDALDCFSVDNALVRPADPLFAGHCWEAAIECGTKVVAKAYPGEKVGVFARRGGAVEVVEYSELDPAVAASADPATGRLRYNWSNVCMHYFSVTFLEAMAQRLRREGAYHIAHKQIPSKDGPVAGVKLELFIFDTFPMAQRTSLLEVRREEEFAPVKNAPGSAADSPDTARRAILSLHRAWVEAAGARVRLPAGAAEAGVEVSPTVSYSGEALSRLCKGRTLRSAHDPFLQGLVPPSQLEARLAEERRAAAVAATPPGSPTAGNSRPGSFSAGPSPRGAGGAISPVRRSNLFRVLKP